MAGVAWTVKILPVRAIGKCGGSLPDMADAIRWAAGRVVTLQVTVPDNAANAAKVIYVGAGTAAGRCVRSNAAERNRRCDQCRIGRCRANGNHGELNISSPANCNGVIAVTAHAINGESTTVREHRSRWWRWAQPDDQRSRWRVAGVARRTGPNR